MIERGKYLRAKMKKTPPYVFLPLIDDSMNSVMHLSMQQLQRCGRTGDGRSTQLVINVSCCGCSQVNGSYLLRGVGEPELADGTSRSGSEEDLRFTNASGFQLCRSERLLAEGEPSASSGVVYDWFLLNPIISCSYYCCTTCCSSTLPPLSGWRVMENGKLPGPFLELVEVDGLAEMKSSAGLGLAVMSVGTKNIY
jgi:hypothetical protein